MLGHAYLASPSSQPANIMPAISNAKTAYTFPVYQRLVSTNPEYQAAIDRLLVATSSNKKRARKGRQARRDRQDEEALAQSWFEYWVEPQSFFDTITFGIVPDWSDDDVADWEGISKSEITNAR